MWTLPVGVRAEEVNETDIVSVGEIESKFKKIVTTESMSAVITSKGSLYVWGWEAKFNGSTIPMFVLDNVADVCIGEGHSRVTALTTSGEVYEWNYNDKQMTKVMEGISQIAVPSDYTYMPRTAVITKNGELYMWDYDEPVKIMDDVMKVSMGNNHNAALTKDGILYMWGRNFRGQVGNGSNTDVSTPKKILEDVADVVLGYDVSAAITKDRTLYMWGDVSGYYSTLGGSGDGATTPRQMGKDVAYVRLASTNRGYVTTGGVLYLWGDNRNGEVSCYEEDEIVYSPITESYYTNVADVQMGSSHVAMLKKDGSLYMWGSNGSGQLGISYKTDYPTKIMDSVLQIKSGDAHSVALTTDGKLYSWGNNDQGQLGHGDETDLNYPKEIKFFSIIDKVESGDNRYTVLILDTSGSMAGTPGIQQKQAAVEFCETVFESKAMNYIAFVELNTSSALLQDFTYDIEYIKKEISGLPSSGGTDIEGALEIAHELLAKVTDEKAVKNIVLCTDGLPESGDVSFGGPYTSLDYSNYAYANAAYSRAQEMKPLYYMYSLGFLHALNGSEYAFAERFLTDIQNAGYYPVTYGYDLEDVFKEIANDLDADDLVKSLNTDSVASTFVGNTMTINGKLVLRYKRDTSADVLTNEVNAIKWTSSDQSIIPDTGISCTGVNVYDNCSAELLITCTPQKEGIVTLTGTTSNGVVANCMITVIKNATSDNGNNSSNHGTDASSKTNLTTAQIKLSKSSYVYDGKKKQPAVTVKIGNQMLKKGTQYKVTYKNNKNVGTATVTITGIGNYSGSVSRNFKIVPKGTSIAKVTAKKKGFALKWKKQTKSVSGYQIQYSTSKKFTDKTTKLKTVKKNKTTKQTISKLKGKKKYYIRVRTYKTVKGKEYYSSWSKIKTVTTKK